MIELHSIPASVRRRMLSETLHHQEALNRETWSSPPLEPGDNASSYREMLMDPTISFCISLIQEAILAEPWRVVPAPGRRSVDPLQPWGGRRSVDAGNGNGPERAALAMAHEVERNLRDVDLESALQDALNALWRGFWPQEITWKYAARPYFTRGPSTHQQRRSSAEFRLESLASIDPDQVALELDDHMRVTAVVNQPSGKAAQRVPREKVWLHVHRPGRTRPAGESLLEPAYRAWSSKNRLLQFWGLSIQRFGMTHLRVTVPSNTPPSRQASILETLHNGRLDGVYLLPEDAKVQEVSPTQWANLTFEAAIDYQDAEIVKAIVLARSPGSVATGQTYVTGAGLHEQARATGYRLRRISRALSHSFTEQVIQPLCAANWGAAPCDSPRLELPVPDPDRIVALAEPLFKLVDSGIATIETAAGLLGFPDPKDAWSGAGAGNSGTNNAEDGVAPSTPETA